MVSSPSRLGRYESDEKLAMHALFLSDDNGYLFERQQFNSSSRNRVGDFRPFYSTDKMHVSILSRRYSSSCSPYARR
jgi:hypothetical protein